MSQNTRFLSKLGLLDGVIDIYMPDMKYGDAELAHRYSHVRDYVQVNHAAVREMHRQVGDLEIDERGVARRGLLVRHLVLPNRIAGSARLWPKFYRHGAREMRNMGSFSTIC
jgi:putative pyruvate formate lyase activating enzyme